MRRIISVECVEFEEGGRTLWVQGRIGTVLRVQLPLGSEFQTTSCGDRTAISHLDLTIERLQANHPVVFCLGADLLTEETLDHDNA